MIEAALVAIGWLAVATWVISSLWRVCVDAHRRRGSNPPPPPVEWWEAPMVETALSRARPQPTGGRLIALDRDPGQPSLGLSMDREIASRLDDLERRVALLEQLTRTLSAELNRLRHG